MKLSLKNLGLIATVCTVLTGSYTMTQHSKTNTQSTSVDTNRPQITAKAAVNIEGTIILVYNLCKMNSILIVFFKMKKAHKPLYIKVYGLSSISYLD